MSTPEKKPRQLTPEEIAIATFREIGRYPEEDVEPSADEARVIAVTMVAGDDPTNVVLVRSLYNHNHGQDSRIAHEVIEHFIKKSIYVLADPRRIADEAVKVIVDVAMGHRHRFVLDMAATIATPEALESVIGRKPREDELATAHHTIAAKVELLTRRVAESSGIDLKWSTAPSVDAIEVQFRSAVQRQIEEEERKRNGPDGGPHPFYRHLDRIASVKEADLCRDRQRATWVENNVERERDGMLAIDASFVEAMRSTGAADLADEEAEAAQERWKARSKEWFAFREGDPHARGALWRRWLDPTRGYGYPFVELFARAAWVGVVRPELERERNRRPAGIVRTVVADRLLPAMTRQLVIPALDDGRVLDARGNTIGTITLTTDVTMEVARKGLAQLGSVAGHRLIRTLVHRAHDQYEAGVGDCRLVRFDGGFAALLETIRLGPNYGATIREIAEAGQAVRWNASHVEGGGFWTWTHQRGARGRSGHVSFVLGEVLLPGLASAMKGKSIPARMARRIIPELRGEVPIHEKLSTDKHGAVWTLHRMMLVELVDQAASLAANGFATIPPKRLADHARDAGIAKHEDLTRVLDAFVNGAGRDAPIFKQDGDGWTLADQHERERAYIVQFGKSQRSGKSRGEAAARKRRGISARRRKPVNHG